MKNIHFIAIGGSAMHNLAIALYEKGLQISGSDDEIFEPSFTRLKKRGLLPEKLGWFPEKITTDLDAIILGMHAKKDNPELLEAKKKNIKIYSYPEFLYEQTKYKKRIVIGGSHGKTTTTAIVMHILKSVNINFDYMVGAQLEGFGNMVRLTESAEYAVFEGDEYLSSPIDLKPKFHWYKPHIALLTGIAWDHINVFPSFENYCSQFERFTQLLEKNATLIYFEEDEELKKITRNVAKEIKLIPYKTANYKIKENKTFLIKDENKVEIELFGKHNLQNISGAYHICKQIGINDKDFYRAIATFSGANKRLQLLAKNKNSLIFQDFAHSPSKLKATVDAVKEQFPEKKLIAIMELHTFSSLSSEFLKLYKGSLLNADKAIVYYSLKAIELKKLQKIDDDLITKGFDKESLKVLNDKIALEKEIYSLDLSDSVLLFLSSGNFSGINLQKLASDLIS